MVSKFLEKQVEIVLDGSMHRGENSLELEYYLLESDSAGCADEQPPRLANGMGHDERKPQKAYGIEIVKKHLGILNERKQFENIFSTREKTKKLLELLAENTVTPSALPYILDDLLGQ